jgi:(1->4)-alpha-D-glucan 1-alpha-D-glucosylmutase
MPNIPSSTYRLQLHADFNFDAAAAISDYLEQLGVSHAYCSPYLQAAPGSLHGYDVVDHHHVNEELGGAEAHARFCKRLDEVHLGQVLDVVPNHMAIAGRHNHYWWDVLENGPASRYATFFDIEWQPLEEKLRNKVLVPILGDHYGRALSRHEISVVREEGDFFIVYFDHRLPAAPRGLSTVLGKAAARINSDYLAFLADSFEQLPSATATGRDNLLARHRDKQVIHALVARLCRESPSAAAAIDSELEILSADLDALDAFLERQNYRLAFWKTAGEELMYRRFFDVTTLVALRMESSHVFQDTHSLILDWLKRGVLDGIRIDHPDGLRDPEQYFMRLRKSAPDAWIVVEKIIEPGEKLPENWPVDGTTGYDFLCQAGGLFIHPGGLERVTSFYREFTGKTKEYEDLCRDNKHLVMREILASDVNRLVSLFVQICENHRDHRDYTRNEINRAIRELVACFSVYRTYVVAETAEISASDVKYVSEATEHAKARRPEIDPDLFDFFRDVLLLKHRGDLENSFVMRFQQFTGPAMAKGVEDTTFYGYNRLTWANEVGGDPGRPVVTVGQFHEYCAGVQARHPLTMQDTSTHDTKRSEDVRARIHLLSEVPDAWGGAVRRWAALNENLRTGEYPDRNSEYLLYQTMVGAWPLSQERLAKYMEKATREAKQCTSWLSPNEEFENALRKFIEGIYRNAPFLDHLAKFVGPLVAPGRVSSLAQVLLKLTVPGIPDLYQGMELWELSLVDPDNRRPVDYDLRRKLLAELPSLKVDGIMHRSDEGLPKLWLTYQGLKARRQFAGAFGKESPYTPLAAGGSKADHVIAYQRGSQNGNAVIAVAPRLIVTLNNKWGSTAIDIPAGLWTNQLTGEIVKQGPVRLKDLLSKFPVALLARKS